MVRSSLVIGVVLLFFGAAMLQGTELKCGVCHTAEAQGQQHSAMAHAIAPPGANPVFRAHPSLKTQRGHFTYKIETKGTETSYSVSDGTSTISVPIHWSFGADNQTFVFQYAGHWYEGLVSYFSAIRGLDTTLGDESLQPASLAEALGRPIDQKEREACFGCHSSKRSDSTDVRPGVTCDHCHVNALQHQAAILKGSLANRPPKLGAMTAFDAAQFCGQCHRTWETVMRMPPVGLADVRFQPFRLANSKCFNGGDSRIACIACHDPHSASLPSATTVTQKCIACHDASAQAKVCPVSKTDCASCHMPKFELPGGHKQFTDHDIRIVKTGEPYPY